MDLDEAEDILGVSRHAPEDRIKDQFRRMARKEHPDNSDDPDAVSKFQRLEKAKRTLLNGDDPVSDPSDTEESGPRQRDDPSGSSTTVSGSSTGGNYRTRGSVGAQQTEQRPGERSGGQSARVSSDVWTGLSFRELLIHLRHHTVPYLSTFWYRTKESGPILAVLFGGFLGLIFTEDVVDGFLQLGIVIAGQCLVARQYTKYSMRQYFKGKRSDYVYAEHPYYNTRGYLPIVGCALAWVILEKWTGGGLSSAVTAISTSIGWIALTLVLAVFFYILVATIHEPRYLGTITLVAAILSFILGFTTWGSPAIFSAPDTAYNIVGSIVLLGVDVGLLINVALPLVLLYSTIGFYLYSSQRIVLVTSRDRYYGSSVIVEFWYLLVGLPLTVFFWLGSNPRAAATVTHYIDPAVLAGAMIAAPGYVHAIYLLRRQLERIYRESKEFTLGALFREFP